MAEDRIDSVVDRGAVQKELSETSAEVRQLIDLIKSVKNTSIEITGAKSVGEFNTLNKQLQEKIKLTDTATGAVKNQTQAIQENTKATIQESQTLKQNIELRRQLQNTVNSYKQDQKEDLALLKSGAITRVEYNKRLTESQAKIEVYKTRIGELNRVIKEDIAIEGKATDAYKQLSAEYNRAALAAKNYTIVLGANHPKTIEAVANAKKLSDRLKDIDNQVGQNTRNVGNYGAAITGAFQKGFSALRTIANIIPGIGIAGLFGAAFEGISLLFNNTSKEAEELAKKLKELIVPIEDIKSAAEAGTVEELSKVGALTDAVLNQSLSYKERNAALNQLKEINKSYFGDLTVETAALGLLKTRVDEYTQALINQAVIKGFQDEIGKMAIEISKQEKQFKSAEDGLRKYTNELSDAKQTVVEHAKGLSKLSIESGRLKKDNEAVGDAINKVNKAEKAYKEQSAAIFPLYRQRAELQEQINTAVKDSLKYRPLEDPKKEGKKDKSAEEQAKRDEAEAKARFEILKLELEIRADFANEIVKDDKKSYSERLLALNDFAKAKQELIDATAEYELTNTKLTADEIKLIESKRIDATLRLAHALSDAIKQTVKDFKQATPAFSESVGGMTKSIAKAIEEIHKKNDELKDGLEKNLKAIKEATKQLLSEVQGLIFDIFTGDIDRQKNAIQDRIDLLDKQKQKEIEVANQTITNAQDKAAAIAVIEARANAQKEQLERKQRELEQRRAKFERAESIVNIITSTAQAVVGALAQVKTIGPAASVLAAVYAAIGAVQLARVLAQPIPKFGQGGVHKGGLMEVGDAGRSEGILLPDGSLLKSPAKSTFVDAPAGTKIFADYDKMMLNATMTKVPTFNVKTISDGTKDAINKVGKDIVRAIKNQPQTIFKPEPRWKKFMKQGSNFKDYIN